MAVPKHRGKGLGVRGGVGPTTQLGERHLHQASATCMVDS